MKNAILGAAALALAVAGLASCGDNAECSNYKFDFVDGQDYNVVFYKTATLMDTNSSVWTFTGCEEELSAGLFVYGPTTVPFVRDKTTMTFLNKIYTIAKESRSRVEANDGTTSVVFTKVD